MENNYNRFSRVVEDYLRYRPHYPYELVDRLKAEDCRLSSSDVIADIGSGTGFLTEVLLKHGNTVYGVEPNAEMRAAAESYLHPYPRFTSISGTAESTGLPDHSIQIITVGHAFQWFQAGPTRQEFLRILIPGGWVVLVHNMAVNDGTPFTAALDEVWKQYFLPHTWSHDGAIKPPESISSFFYGNFKQFSLDNSHACDLTTLQGRALSFSFSPEPEDPKRSALLAELADIFYQYQMNGVVNLAYQTVVVYGQLIV